MVTPENVSRRDMLLLGLAGIGTLATTACAENSTMQTSPSNIQTPTEIPTNIRIPSASELLSDREMREAFKFPNWQTELQNAVNGGHSEEKIGDKLAASATSMLNFLANPMLHVDKEIAEQLKRASLGKDSTEKFAEDLQEHVALEFANTAIVDPNVVEIKRFLAWINNRGIKDTGLFLSQECGSVGKLTTGDQFYRTFKLVDGNTEYDVDSNSNRIVTFKISTESNLSPSKCEEYYRALEPETEENEITLVFEQPRRDDYYTPMRIQKAYFNRV